jgi:hypothetical protein
MSQGTASETPDPGKSDHPDQKEVPQNPIVMEIGQAGSHDENAVKIGLWGPQESGKTTFLAALPIAVSDGKARNGSWLIYPHGKPSWELLERFEKVLVEDRRFPQATAAEAAELKWLFVGDLAESRFDRRMLRRLLRRGELESRFVLDLIDVPGVAYRRDLGQPAANSQVASAALDHLAGAQGIIYLFDPIGERDNRNSAAYVRGTVNELLLRAAANGRRPGRYLPHQVSVCITKFDHHEMFHQARRMNLVSYGDDGMPRVRDEDAEQFFDELCTGKFWSTRYDRGQESAQFVRDKIRQVFRPDHIRYFVTSSIGFWMEPPADGEASAWFNLDDFANYNERDGELIIRDKVRPINVIEPLISLQQRIARR